MAPRARRGRPHQTRHPAGLTTAVAACCPGLCFRSASQSTLCLVEADPRAGQTSWALVAAVVAWAAATLAADSVSTVGALLRRPARPLRRCGRRRTSRSTRASTRTRGCVTPTGRRTRPSATAALTGTGAVVAAGKGAAGAMADGGARPKDWRSGQSCTQKNGVLLTSTEAWLQSTVTMESLAVREQSGVGLWIPSTLRRATVPQRRTTRQASAPTVPRLGGRLHVRHGSGGRLCPHGAQIMAPHA